MQLWVIDSGEDDGEIYFNGNKAANFSHGNDAEFTVPTIRLCIVTRPDHVDIVDGRHCLTDRQPHHRCIQQNDSQR